VLFRSPEPTPETPLCPWFEGRCPGLNFPLNDRVVSFRDYQVVTFGDFNSFDADVEGRVACQGKLNVTNYSIGLQLQTTLYENSMDYALVVGGDASFNSGSVYPDGTNNPYPGKQELIFVGGTFTAPQYLQDLRPLPQGACGFPGCLDSIFNSAHSCYRAFSNDLASQTPNAVSDVKYNGLHIVCASNEDLRHVVNINPSDLISTTYFWTENCNLQAEWVLNLGGTGDVTFTGDSFPANPGAVLINFPGKNRRLTINNSVAGSILAPDNEIYQANGVIIGKIVAGNVARVKQVNIVHCPTPDQIKLQVPTGKTSPPGSVIYLYSVDSIRVGDTIENLNGSPTVTDVNFDDNYIGLDSPHSGINDVNFILTVDVSDSRASRFIPPKVSPSSGPSGTEEAESSAAVITPVIAAFFALVLAFF